MENVEIANVLSEVADLLDILGENPFRVRAYRNAVRTIGNLTRPLAGMVAEGSALEDLPGIGKDIAAHIVELVETGRLERLEELHRRAPASLAELVRVEGLGPKRARQLYEQLGVRTLDDLQAALNDGRLRELRGFGEKTESRIRLGLEELRQRPQRFRLADADQFVGPLLDYMRQAPGVERVEAAGSFRRRAETVGDVDLLAICARPAPVMKRFTGYPDVARVEAAGGTRGTVVLRSGLQVDLRILPRRCYGAALHYFTGSKAHNIAVRTLGVERGLRINEYGVFRISPASGKRRGAKRGRRVPARRAGGARRSATATKSSRGAAKARRVGGAEETDVFDAVGMSWVPPELREDRGEIEAALANRLPSLIRLEDIRGDLQTHSEWTDGHDTIEAMARAALDAGYEYLAMTDHSRAVTVAGGLDVADVKRQWKEITGVRRKLRGRLRLLRGLEVDILRDGSLDMPDALLAGLDIVVVAVHSHLGLSKKAMTERVIRGISHPAVDILAHPTGRLINQRPAYAIDMDAVLHAAAELDVAVEINAQPDRLDLNDVLTRRARDLGVTLVIDTDAHTSGTLAFMRHGVDQARRGWIEPGDVLNTRPLSELAAWLDRRGARPAMRRLAGRAAGPARSARSRAASRATKRRRRRRTVTAAKR